MALLVPEMSCSLIMQVAAAGNWTPDALGAPSQYESDGRSWNRGLARAAGCFVDRRRRKYEMWQLAVLLLQGCA